MLRRLSINSLIDLVEAMTYEIPFQQQCFNYHFMDLYEQFLPVAAEAKRLGLEALAVSVFPRPCVLSNVEIDIRFQITESSEAATSLQVKPLHLGFNRRFAHSGTVEQRIQVTVQKLAPEPGKQFHRNLQTEGRTDNNG
jgi:hypothetical protein